MQSIADNYRAVCDNIAEAAIKVGRNPDDVKLICVTKFVDEARIEEAVRAGAASVGENRVQEFLQKQSFFKSYNLDTHLIGQLQTNKVKYVIGEVSIIHSVDRLSLALEINRLCELKHLVQDIMLEVNLAGEKQKGGIDEHSLCELLGQISAMKGVRVVGLMCIPPVVTADEARGYFARLRRLSEDIKGTIPGICMKELSMGMSGDYEQAVYEGATMVRVGSAVFGHRQTTAG